VKRLYFLATLVAAVLMLSSGCGTSDYLQSVQLSALGAEAGGTYNLPGVDGTLQLQATAVYHSGKSVPVTAAVTFTGTPHGQEAGGGSLPPLTPPTPGQPGSGTEWISSTGLMQTVLPLCTWTDLASGNPPVLPTPPQYNWVIDGYYQIVATYRGMQSNPIAVGIGSAAGNAPDGSCGPK
jgi:hypothetical protein